MDCKKCHRKLTQKHTMFYTLNNYEVYRCICGTYNSEGIKEESDD